MEELRNDLTKMMDEHINDDDKIEGMYVYIYASDDNKPAIFDDGDEYGWYLRYPGYTCGNIIFDKKTNTVKDIILTRRGGGFAISGHETIFDNPDNLRVLLLQNFKGKTLDYYCDDDL